MPIPRVYYVPKTLGELHDRFGTMASKAPEYKGIYDGIYEPHDGPAGEFAATREGLENVRSKLGDRAYEYLLARIDENWQRLQTGEKEDLRKLKLSFGEMVHFLRTRKYKAENLTEEWADYTNVR